MKQFKLIAPVLLSILSVQFASAQNSYITHTLRQGETLSALAKEYNTSVGDIMRLNGMHADSKLVYGSKIKVPVAEVQNSSNQKTLTVNEQINPLPTHPVTHTVAQSETLYSISKQYNVSMEQLKAWNNLADYNIKLGTTLVVGNNADVSASINQTKKQRVETADQTQNNISTQQQEPQNNILDNVNEQQQVSNTNSQISSQAAYNNLNSDVNNHTFQNNEPNPVLSQNGEGYFADQFTNKKSKRLQNISGICKTFKTASGWSDGKYYILANDIDPGTIVKLTTENGNTVYAKVLWNMGDLKENAGINFRISNATAAALNLNAPAFNLSVSY
jgi:LysM repeat protein